MMHVTTEVGHEKEALVTVPPCLMNFKLQNVHRISKESTWWWKPYAQFSPLLNQHAAASDADVTSRL